MMPDWIARIVYFIGGLLVGYWMANALRREEAEGV